MAERLQKALPAVLRFGLEMVFLAGLGLIGLGIYLIYPAAASIYSGGVLCLIAAYQFYQLEAKRTR